MLGGGVVWVRLGYTRMRAQKCAREQRNPHAPPFSYLSINLFGLFSLGLFACFPFLYTCKAVVCCGLLYTCVYVCVLCGCVLSIYLCNLCYWLNNIMDLLTALKFFCTVAGVAPFPLLIVILSHPRHLFG